MIYKKSEGASLVSQVMKRITRCKKEALLHNRSRDDDEPEKSSFSTHASKERDKRRRRKDTQNSFRQKMKEMKEMQSSPLKKLSDTF